MTDISITKVNEEIANNFNNQATANALLATTFKGLNVVVAKEAMLAGMLQGFTFENFLKKDVYAIGYGQSYSLVTSIDWSRKTASRAGLAGKDAPVYQFDDNGNIMSCSVTVYKILDGLRCPFTALVFFKEYTTGKNLWASKPMTMIAKVAEMHALRMAFPEELSQAYVEEEVTPIKVEATPVEHNIDEYKAKLDVAKTIEEMREIWGTFPLSVKNNQELINYAKTKFNASN